MGDTIPTAEDIRRVCDEFVSILPPDHEAVLHYHMSLER